jgi:hypothetical protein
VETKGNITTKECLIIVKSRLNKIMISTFKNEKGVMETKKKELQKHL